VPSAQNLSGSGVGSNTTNLSPSSAANTTQSQNQNSTNSQQQSSYSGSRPQKYGISFNSGDVVGCGIDLVRNTVFFTKNGKNLGLAFKNVAGALIPAAGILNGTCVLSINFGTSPFQFDLKNELERRSEELGATITQQQQDKQTQTQTQTQQQQQQTQMHAQANNTLNNVPSLFSAGSVGFTPNNNQNIGAWNSFVQTTLSCAHREHYTLSFASEGVALVRHLLQFRSWRERIEEYIESAFQHLPSVMKQLGNGE